MSAGSPARRTPISIYPLDTGGCSACAHSVHALQADRYVSALRERRITFARDARHADVILVTGVLSQHAEEPVMRILEGVPEPRAIIAVGNCALDGCVFADSPPVNPSAAETLEAHVEIAGCPPDPEAVLDAIIEAQALLSRAVMSGALAKADSVDDDEDIDETAGIALDADDSGISLDDDDDDYEYDDGSIADLGDDDETDDDSGDETRDHEEGQR